MTLKNPSTKKTTARRSSTVAGNRVKPLDPGYLSLVRHPANQRSFSIVRSADGGEAPPEGTVATPGADAKPQRRITRRSDTANSIQMVEFPAGYDKEQAQAKLTEFGLISYDTEAVEGKNVVARRKDLQSPAKAEDLVPIVLSKDGIKAYVARADLPASTGPAKNKITVAAFEFDTAKLSEEEISAFIARNAVDKDISALDNSGDTVSVLRRSEIAEGEEVRRVEVEKGVVAVITRSDDEDIPDGFVAIINERAYGQWGWGQLDFMAIWMDRYVCEQMEEARWMFESVINRILFYSDLPLDVRKALVSRATAQYESYLHGLLDLLPRQMLLAVGAVEVQRSDDVELKPELPTQENDMTGTAATQTPAATEGMVSRAEFDAALKQQKTEILAGVGDAVAQAIARSAEDAKKAEADAKAEAERQEAIQRADKERLDGLIAEAVKPLQEQLEKLGGTTVLRSAPAGKETPAKPEGDTAVKRSDAEVMQGAIPGLRGGLTTKQAERQ